MLDSPGWTETAYRRLDEADGRNIPSTSALVRVFKLPGGFRLLVGRDLEERERLYNIVLAAGRWSRRDRDRAGARRRLVRDAAGCCAASTP